MEYLFLVYSMIYDLLRIMDSRSSILVAGSNVIGCKLRFYLSLQLFPYYNKSGTVVKIAVFMSA